MTQYRSRVAKAALIVMAGYVASKGVGLVRDRIIAQTFGAGTALDAYYVAFNLPDLIFSLIAGGALATAFIPVFAEKLALDEAGQEVAWRLASNVLTFVLLATVVLSGLVALLAEPLIATIIAPRFAPEQQLLAASLMRIILLSTIIFSASGMLMGVLNARQHFLSPAFAPLFYNLGIIGGALLFARTSEGPAIEGLAWGSVLGALLHLLTHIPALIQQRARLWPYLNLADPDFRQVLRLMGPRVMALLIVQANTQIIQENLASGLAPGSITALTYAWNLMQLPETIFATAVATAVFPTLAELASRRETEALRQTMSETLRTILAFTIPAAMGMLVLGRPLIALLLEGGAFDANATDMVYFALQFYALGLIAHSLLEIVARTFYAQQDTVTPLIISVGAMGLNVVLALLLLGPLQHGGLALANSLAVAIQVIVGLWLLHRRLGHIYAGATTRATVQMVVAAGMMGLVVALWVNWSAGSHLLVVGGVGALLGAVTYGGVALLLGLEEVRLIPAILLRRWRPAAAIVAPGESSNVLAD